MNPQQQQLDPQVVTMTKAIRQVESGGDFQAKGKSGEYGGYQFTRDTWNAWAPKYLGVSVPLEQATPQMQNEVAYKRIKEWKDAGANVGQVASMWNAGEGRPNAYLENWRGTNSQGVSFDTPLYAQRVAQAYQGLKDGSISGTPSTMPQAPTNGGRPTYGATFPYEPGDNGFVAGFKALGNLPSSVYGFGKGIYDILRHPIQTAESLGSAAIGGVQKLTGDKDPNDQYSQTFDALKNALVERYGGLDALTNTAVNDPFGFGADIASILAGGAGLAGKGAELAGVASKVARPIVGVGERAAGEIAEAGAATGRAVFGGANEEAIAAAHRLGVELPAGAQTTNPIVRSLETLASTGAGAEQSQARLNAAITQLERKAQEIVRSTGGVEDLATAGSQISKGLQEYEKTFKKTVGGLFDAVTEKAGDIAAQTERSITTIQNIIDAKLAVGETQDLKWFQDKLAVLNGGTVEFVPEGAKVASKKSYPPPTFTTLKKVRTALGEKIDKGFDDPFVRSNVAQLKQLYGALSSDIRTTIKATGDKEVLNAYDAANRAYIAGRNEIASQFAKTIRRLAERGQFSKIAEDLIKPSTPLEDIPRILAVIGEQGAANVRASVIQKILDAARNVDGDLTPKGLMKAMDKYKLPDGKSKLEALLTPDQIQGLTDMGKVTEALGDSLKQAQGSQTFFLLRKYAELGALGSGAIAIMSGNPLLGLKLIGGVLGSEGASYFLASKTGQRLLTLGISKGAEAAKAAEEMGIATKGDDTIPGNGNGGEPGAGSGGSPVAPAGGAPSPAGAAPAASALDGGNVLRDSGDVAQRAAELTEKNGGVTIALNGDIPEGGYAFAPSKTTERAIPLETYRGTDDVLQYAKDNAELLAQPGAHLGLWKDNGKVYLDVSIVEPDFNVAMDKAAQADQIAIFDLSKFETHNLADYEKIDSAYTRRGENSGGAGGGSGEGTGGKGDGDSSGNAGGNDDAAVAQRAQELLDAKKDALVKQYLKENGNIVNSDLAKPLFKEVGYNGVNSAAVHPQSQKVAAAAWQEGLKRKGEAGIIFAGGSGVGKSSSLSRLDPKVRLRAAVIWDGNSSGIVDLKKRVNELIDAGKFAQVAYVFRPIKEAYMGTILRGLRNKKEMGRLVPSSVVVDNHAKSYEAMKAFVNDPETKQLIKEKKLAVSMFDNSGSPKDAKKLPLAKFNKIAYNADKDLAALRELNQKLYDRKTITKEQYEALNR